MRSAALVRYGCIGGGNEGRVELTNACPTECLVSARVARGIMTAFTCVLHPRIRCLTGEQVATIRGSDTDEVDRFGWSVAISGDPMSDMFVAVGAPGADDNGVLEVQELHCSTCPSTSQPMSGALLAPRPLPTITLAVLLSYRRLCVSVHPLPPAHLELPCSRELGLHPPVLRRRGICTHSLGR